MGFKVGLFLGILAGAAAAAVLAKPRPALAPSQERSAVSPASPATPLKDTLDQVRRRASEALDAAYEAAQETEEELRRQYERTSRRET